MRQIGDAQHLAESQVADVDLDVAGNVARQAFEFDFAQHLFQNAALLLHPGRLRP